MRRVRDEIESPTARPMPREINVAELIVTLVVIVFVAVLIWLI